MIERHNILRTEGNGQLAEPSVASPSPTAIAMPSAKPGAGAGAFVRACRRVLAAATDSYGQYGSALKALE